MQMYDPKTKEVTTIDTCFGTHHLNFDDKDVLWFTGGGAVEGWFDTRIYDKTKDETKAQGGRSSSSIPTAMGSETLTSNPISRSIPQRTNESTRRSTA